MQLICILDYKYLVNHWTPLTVPHVHYLAHIICTHYFFLLPTILHTTKTLFTIMHVCGLLSLRSITRAYYRNSVGGLLLFDITNRRSFQNVHEWLEEARSHVQPHSIVFLLVGHKCDLEAQRQVSRQEAEKLAAAYGMRYVETSARDAINVERAFTELTRDIFELVKNGEITIQEGWEGVKSGFVPNVVHSSEEVTKGDRRCFCWISKRTASSNHRINLQVPDDDIINPFLPAECLKSHHAVCPSLFYTTMLISPITQACDWANRTGVRLLVNYFSRLPFWNNDLTVSTSIMEPRKLNFPNEDVHCIRFILVQVSREMNKTGCADFTDAGIPVLDDLKNFDCWRCSVSDHWLSFKDKSKGDVL